MLATRRVHMSCKFCGSVVRNWRLLTRHPIAPLATCLFVVPKRVCGSPLALLHSKLQRYACHSRGCKVDSSPRLRIKPREALHTCGHGGSIFPSQDKSEKPVRFGMPPFRPLRKHHVPPLFTPLLSRTSEELSECLLSFGHGQVPFRALRTSHVRRTTSPCSKHCFARPFPWPHEACFDPCPPKTCLGRLGKAKQCCRSSNWHGKQTARGGAGKDGRSWTATWDR